MHRAIERMRGRTGLGLSDPGRTRRAEGFTLVEMLVVIAIIMILLALFGSLLIFVVDRSRNTKTIGLIKTLHDGCAQYRSLEMFKKYPENAAGNSNTLHFHLGAPMWVVKQWVSGAAGPMMEQRPPIVFFNPGWLEGQPTNTDPGVAIGTAKNVVDAWKHVIKYEAYPGTKYCTAMGIALAGNNGDNYVSIWSLGIDNVDQTGGTGTSDDITNWERVGRVQ